VGSSPRERLRSIAQQQERTSKETRREKKRGEEDLDGVI
jgi:hypothetical protein